MEAMQALLSLGLIIYLIFYVFEGVIRYGFNMIGADALIFTRDLCLLLPLIGLFFTQMLNRKVHKVFLVYFMVIIIHGTVMMINIGSILSVIYTAKMLMTMIVGAILCDMLLTPSRRFVKFILALWLITFVGVLLDKFFVEMPWMGLQAQIGDISVDVSRDWMVEGADKRAAGFMRSSINAATFIPLFAILLMFHLRSLMLRIIISVAAVVSMYWTTQKGAIIGYILVPMCIVAWPKRPIEPLRVMYFISLAMMIIFPIVLSGTNIDSAGGVFSFSSFNDRLTWMWPNAWRWIRQNDAFPFGIGLGGISGAQRLFAPYLYNAADNMFVLMYAFFGMLSFFYFGWLSWRVIKLGHPNDAPTTQAVATLVFLMAYGIVISILEDQMASLFMGACMWWVYEQSKPKPKLLGAVPSTQVAVS
jgi:hypothetical protein